MLVAWAELKERSYGADCRIYTPENPTNKFANVWVGDCPPGFCMPSKQRLLGLLSGSGQSDQDLSVAWSKHSPFVIITRKEVVLFSHHGHITP